jgi:hypothetical protein
VIKPWQPAFPQAMQRHGGQTRPAAPPPAKRPDTPSRDETSGGEGRTGATADDATAETKNKK